MRSTEPQPTVLPRSFLLPILAVAGVMAAASLYPLVGGDLPIDSLSERRLLLAAFSLALGAAGMLAVRLVDARKLGATGGLLRVQTAVVASAFLPIAAVNLGRMLDANSGDASVYLGFARYAWEAGFFHYGAQGPVHGASSPLWAVLLMLVEPVARLEPWLRELPGLLSAVAAVIATFRLTRVVGGNLSTALLAAALLASAAQTSTFAGKGFETSLVMALVCEAVRATVLLIREPSTRAAACWASTLALLALTRPEGVLFAAVLSAASVVSRWRTHPRLLMWAIAAAILPLSFHLWMYAETGILVPASVRARVVTSHAPTELWQVVRAAFGIPWAPGGHVHEVAFLLLVATGVAVVARQGRAAAVVLVAPILVMLAAFAIDPPGAWVSERYGALSCGLSASAAAIGLVAMLRQLELRLPAGGPLRLTLALSAVGLLVGPACLRSTHWAGVESGPPMDEVLDRSGGEWIDANLPSDARLLTYEIQAQAKTSRQLISADGIVGGEILPFLERKALADFVREARISHVAVSYGYRNRQEYEGTLLRTLWERDPEVALGETLQIEGLRLEKVAARPESERLRAHWTAIYAVR